MADMNTLGWVNIILGIIVAGYGYVTGITATWNLILGILVLIAGIWAMSGK